MPIFTLKEILELMDRVAERGLGLLEIESSGMRVKIEGRRAEALAQGQQPELLRPQFQAPSGAPPAIAPSAPPVESEDSWHLITAPIVGTFYRSPNPESEAFVEVGDHVNKGRILCIIEAMKLMNEIEADAEGVVVKVYPQNGQPVEYGEKLFALKPA